MAHMQGSSTGVNVVDKRKALSAAADSATHFRGGTALFTANGAGTTTTLVGANAAPGTNDNNVVRRGDKFVLFTGAGVLKEEKIFTITNVAVAGSTTVTFSPAAAGATASGDVARRVDLDNFMDEANLDTRLLALSYTQSQINQMNQNDKVYAVRLADNPDSI